MDWAQRSLSNSKGSKKGSGGLSEQHANENRVGAWEKESDASIGNDKTITNMATCYFTAPTLEFAGIVGIRRTNGAGEGISAPIYQ
jgi:hypothetical protein